jgi:hypothetical protein
LPNRHEVTLGIDPHRGLELMAASLGVDLKLGTGRYRFLSQDSLSLKQK